MRYLRIFSIYFQDALQYRSTSFVYFLLALINPLMILLFWRGAFQSGGASLTGWSYNTIASYYLVLMLANVFLMTHVENEIAYRDIQSGGLSQYLTRPFSYILLRYFYTLPYRFIQGFFGLLTLAFFIFVLNMHIQFVQNIGMLLLAFFTAILAQLVAFLFKIILGLSALWVTEYSGLQQLVEVATIVLAGFVMPLTLFPDAIRTVVTMSPFAYMIYFPVVSFLGKVTLTQSLQIILGEMVWLVLLYCFYLVMWKNGIKKFTGIGQ